MIELAVIGSLLNSFVPKLWGVIQDSHKQRVEVEQGIESIKEGFRLVSSFIQDHELQRIGTSREVSKVIDRARRLAQHTEYCICRFLYQSRAGARARARAYDRVSHMQFAIQIRELKKKLGEIMEELGRLGPESTTSTEEPDQSGEEDPPVVGMKVPLQELQELLECTPTVNTGSESKGKLKVISIVGFGGSGKTRLAKQVYTDCRRQFDPHATVSVGKRNLNLVLADLEKEMSKNVSAGPSTGVTDVLKSCLSKLRIQKDAQPIHSDANVTERLQKFLCKKRYLIVIDDVRRIEDWVTLEKVFPDSDAASRIIVTTTSQSVAARCSFPNGHVYKMSTLCDGDSEKLFLNALSVNRSRAAIEELSTLIKICDGLPLALIESAECLKGKKVEKDACQEVIRMLCAPEEEDDVTLRRMQWVLMNKYSSLTNYGARACLLYFHMFPVDNPAKRKSLTRRWLAEELVQKDDAKCSDLDAASKHLKTLVDRNIIRPMQVSSNANIKSCRLPGTMHEFISRKSISQNFVTFSYRQVKPDEPKYVRRLSLHGGPDQYSTCIEDVELYLLRTLAVSGKACKHIMDFSQYEILRVLDLKGCDYKLDEKILKAICRLVMLKYLGLPGNTGTVPREILDLVQLETLDLDESEITVVYGEVIKLTSLKHLLGKFCLSSQDTSTHHVAQGSRLETLSGFVTNQSATFAKLMIHMKQLTKVKMWCDFKPSKGGSLFRKGDGGEVKHVSTAIERFISRGEMQQDDVRRSLSIDVRGCKVQFLESLQASCKLAKLKLCGRLHRVPEFITGQAMITELCLSSTTLCGTRRLFPFLVEDGATLLPLLRYLKLVEDDLGPLKILPNHFPSLERICLVGTNTLNGITIQDGALEFLVSLHIMCKALDGLAGIQIGGLKRLEEIELDSEVGVTRDAHPEEKSTYDAWKEAARDHPNMPRVLLIGAAPSPRP